MKKYLIILFIVFIYGDLYSQYYTQISVPNARNLVFGSILPGITTSIATTVTSAGRYQVAMTANMTVSLTFNLPANLTSGSNTMPITYIATKSNSSTDGTAGTTFSPYTGTTIRRTGTSTANFYIRVGGSIPTPSTQVAGAYTGTIIMTMTITGA